MDEVEQQGWDDRLHDLSFSDNPYPRRTEAFDAWRKGWAAADNHLWQGAILRKAASE